MRGNREDGAGATPGPRAFRRRPGRPVPAPKNDAERIADVAAAAHLPVEDVLRDVAEFRLALETDMIIAAAAVDADSPETLSEVIDGERLELATFHDRLLERLADAAADDELAVVRRARQPRRSIAGRATQAVAAAAAALAVFGATRAITPSSPETTVDATEVAAMEDADQRYADFSSAVTSESPVAVRAAADQLHESIEQLINDHAHDPAVAQRAAQLLQAEISLLRANDPQGASRVLAEARTLIVLLQQAAPPKVRASVKPVLDAAVAPPTTSSKPKPKKTASPSPTAKPTTKPTASPTPTATRTSAPDDSGTGPLDTP
jgi:hypothetical protein